jgi:hypothetical protein
MKDDRKIICNKIRVVSDVTCYYICVVSDVTCYYICVVSDVTCYYICVVSDVTCYYISSITTQRYVEYKISVRSLDETFIHHTYRQTDRRTDAMTLIFTEARLMNLLAGGEIFSGSHVVSVHFGHISLCLLPSASESKKCSEPITKQARLI